MLKLLLCVNNCLCCLLYRYFHAAPEKTFPNISFTRAFLSTFLLSSPQSFFIKQHYLNQVLSNCNILSVKIWHRIFSYVVDLLISLFIFQKTTDCLQKFSSSGWTKEKDIYCLQLSLCLFAIESLATINQLKLWFRMFPRCLDVSKSCVVPLCSEIWRNNMISLFTGSCKTKANATSRSTFLQATIRQWS